MNLEDQFILSQFVFSTHESRQWFKKGCAFEGKPNGQITRGLSTLVAKPCGMNKSR